MIDIRARTSLSAACFVASLLFGTALPATSQTAASPAAQAAGTVARETTPGRMTTGTMTPGAVGDAATKDAESTLTGERAGTVQFQAAPGAAAATTREDYPTPAVADYVFACMATNGETRQSLQQCSCSFDVVASIIPYERYVEASTWLSMGQVTGEKGSLFRESAESKASIGDLRRAQAEAEIRCFE